jgi:hypothetical protein
MFTVKLGQTSNYRNSLLFGDVQLSAVGSEMGSHRFSMRRLVVAILVETYSESFHGLASMRPPSATGDEVVAEIRVDQLFVLPHRLCRGKAAS